MSSIEKISFAQFKSRGRRAVENEHLPLIIEMPEPIKNGISVDALLEKLGSSTGALFEKAKDPNNEKRSVVTKINLAEFFNEQVYNDPESKSHFRIVTNIRNRPELIKSILGMDLESEFNFQKGNNAANIWINYKGQFGRSHFDELENYNIQLIGSKKFVLLKPGRKVFYVRSMLAGFGHHSKVYDFTTVDLEQYPRLKKPLESKIEVVLEKGQMLYLPLGWWHQVHPLGHINVNLNFWLHGSQIFRHPYVLADALYKSFYRKINGLYDYQPEELEKEEQK